MKCKECKACRKGFFASKPEAYVCIGVPEPFVIDDIDVKCTEYPEKIKLLQKLFLQNQLSHILAMMGSIFQIVMILDAIECLFLKSYLQKHTISGLKENK